MHGNKPNMLVYECLDAKKVIINTNLTKFSTFEFFSMQAKCFLSFMQCRSKACEVAMQRPNTSAHITDSLVVSCLATDNYLVM